MSAPRQARGERDSPGEPRKKRRLRTKLVALGLSLLLGALVVELGARLVIHEDPNNLAGRPLGEKAFHEQLRAPSNEPASPNGSAWQAYALDPQLGFRLAANVSLVCSFAEAPGGSFHWKTNQLALRDERPLDAKNGERILVLGDSQTFGIGVEREQAFPALLEKKLGAGFEVVNVGCAMWGQREENAFLEHRAKALSPDVVVLEVTIANDVLDDLRYKDETGPKGELIPDDALARELEQSALFTFPLLADHSRAYRALVWNLGRHAIRYRAMKDKAHLEHAGALVRRARALSEKLGARFVLLIAPTAAQLEHSLADRVLGTKAINDSFADLAKREQIPLCDPWVHLQAVYASGRTPYFPIDKHWNEAGHEAVATALEPLVRELAK